MTPVTDSLGAMRAYLAGDMDEFGRISDALDPAESRALGYLIPAAFFTAANRRFSDTDNRMEIIDFVGRLRGRSDRVAEALDPRVAERLLVAAVSDAEIDDIDGETQTSHLGPLLVGLIAEAELGDTELDEFLVESRELAESWREQV